MSSDVATAKVCNATGFQYQAFISLDKHDNHIATTIEVRENVITKYVKWISKPATSICSNRNNYIINTLNWKATVVKILLVKITDYSISQNFAPSNICVIRYSLSCIAC